jgi:hypothetical protein
MSIIIRALSTLFEPSFFEKIRSELEDQYGRYVVDTLQRLARITAMMETIGIVCVLLLMSLVACFGAGYLGAIGSRLRIDAETIVVLASVAFVIETICLLAYERLRRTGDTLFDELSSELQWSLRQKFEPPSDPFESRKPPNLTVRIILRRFIKNTDLPLVPGHIGTFIYLIVGLSLWIITLSISVRIFYD